MGTWISMVAKYIEEQCLLSIDIPPASFDIELDYNCAGQPRPKAVERSWDCTMKGMLECDKGLRVLFEEVINKRMVSILLQRKYNDPNCVRQVMDKFPDWTETRVFDCFDLFQLFEVNGDGVIEVTELCSGLDNLGDTTPLKERMKVISVVDKDGSGTLEFEEFIGDSGTKIKEGEVMRKYFCTYLSPFPQIFALDEWQWQWNCQEHPKHINKIIAKDDEMWRIYGILRSDGWVSVWDIRRVL